jgi:hypothetical protein
MVLMVAVALMDASAVEVAVTCPPNPDPGFKLGTDLEKGYTPGKAGKLWPRKPLRQNKLSAS